MPAWTSLRISTLRVLLTSIFVLACFAGAELRAQTAGQASSDRPSSDRPSSAETKGDELRVTTLIQLMHPDGSPWAGARLRLIAWPHSAYPGIGDPDRVQAVSDERGRVRVQLLAASIYQAQASEELEGRKLRISNLQSGLRPGLRTTLLSSYVGVLRGISFEGIEALEPCRLYVEGSNGITPGHEIELESGKPVELPLWPRGIYELRDKNGRAVYAGRFQMLRVSGLRPGQAAEPLEVRIRNLARVQLSVQDPEGRPLPGCKIYDWMQLRRVQLAETDSEGKADFLIGIGLTRSQSRNTPRTYRFRSSFALEHPEYPLYDLRKTHSVFKPEDDKQVPIAKIKVTLQKGSARKIRVLNQAGDPWQGLRLIAHCAAPGYAGKASYNYGWQLLETNAQGLAELQVSDVGRAVRLIALPSLNELAALGADRGSASLAPFLWLADGPLHREVVFDAGRLAQLEIDVRGRDGRRLRSPLVDVTGSATAKESRSGLRHRPRLAASRTGRLVLLHAGTHGGPSLASSTQGFRTGQTGPLEPGQDKLTVQIQADDRRVAGTLRDKEGKPVRFATIRAYWRGNADGVRNSKLRPARSSITIETDAQGRFEFFAPRDSTLQLSASQTIYDEQGVLYRSATRRNLVIPPGQQTEALIHELVLDQETRKGQRRLGGALVAPGGGNAPKNLEKALEDLRAKKADLEAEAEAEAESKAKKGSAKRR
jgi:hypothetical protein